MKGDLSRVTFLPQKHYRTVLQQQGRVTIDADANEEAEILNRRQDDTTSDVIGPTGRPKGEFAVTISGGNVGIGPGTLYVDGIPCVNDTACTLTTQPSLPLDSATLASFPDLAAGAGTYAVYLRAFERLITSVEDPAIREKALGGADTAVRSQLVWQVRLRQLTGLPAGSTCGNIGTTWKAPFNPGAMTAQTVPLAAGAANPCVLPPQAGFRSLENQLYRVEIHQGGPLASATFKWSRENGSVLTAVVPTNPGDTQNAGPVLIVASVGRDANLGFGTEQFVELLDDRIELSGDFQPLSLTKNVTASLSQIELHAAATFPGVFSRSPKLRRWDQTTGDANGIPLSSVAPIQLENGVAVSFSAGDYRAGDYWVIPARTAIDEETGNIEWPTDGMGNLLPQPSRYAEHSCLLSVVTWDGTNLALAPGFTQCVPEFPPLTAIQATDVQFTPVCGDLAGTTTVAQALEALCERQGPCTVVLHPVAGWEQAITQLPAGSDAEICFTVGTFPVAQNGVTIAGLGNIKVSGAGFGTKLSNTAGEICLQFINCASVAVRDLSATATTPQVNRTNGPLTFRNCPIVTVESVHAEISGTNTANAACLSIGPQANGDATALTTLRIRGCTLIAGNAQYGILGVNIVRSQIEDNEIRTIAPAAGAAAPNTLTNLSTLIGSQARVIADAKVVATKADSVITVGTSRVFFTSDSRIRKAALTYIQSKIPANSTPLEVAKQVGVLAGQVASDKAQWAQIQGLAEIGRTFVNASTPVGLRGICLAGTVLNEARILNNSITGFRKGIHIALSHRETSKGAPDVANNILIQGNSIIASMIPSDGISGGKHKGPYAVYVGSVSNLLVLDNQATLNQVSIDSRAPAAVQVFGQIGNRVIVKGNAFDAFTTGAFLQLSPGSPLPPSRLWLVSENVLTRATSAATGSVNPPLSAVTNIVTI